MPKEVQFYLKKALTFFDLTAKTIPPVTFLVVLGMYFIYFYVEQLFLPAQLFPAGQLTDPGGAQGLTVEQPPLPLLLTGLAIILLINVISCVYLSAAIHDAKGEEYKPADCVYAVLRNFPRLFAVTLLKNFVIGAGLFLFVVPGIFLALVLLFSECAVLDQNQSALAGLRRSGVLTNGRKRSLLKVELFCNLIVFSFLVLVLSLFVTNNVAVFQYILLFLISLVTLVEKKLVAYLYVDAARETAKALSADPK